MRSIHFGLTCGRHDESDWRFLFLYRPYIRLEFNSRMKEGRSAFKILTGNLEERDLKGGLGVDGRTILEWTLKR